MTKQTRIMVMGVVMKTHNRKPIKTRINFDGSIHISWKCHGIDTNGNRRKWNEVSVVSKHGTERFAGPYAKRVLLPNGERLQS